MLGLNKAGGFRSVTAAMICEMEIVFAEDLLAVALGMLEVTTVGGEELPRTARPMGRTLALPST